MIKPVQVHTATHHNPDGTATYTAVALMDRTYRTATGLLPETTSPAGAALTAAMEGIKAARTLMKTRLHRRYNPINVRLPSAQLAKAATKGQTASADPGERRVLKFLEKAQLLSNVSFTVSPKQEDSAVETVCREMTRTWATTAPPTRRRTDAD